MALKQTLEVKELRVRFLPKTIHKKIEIYAGKVMGKEGRYLTKENAAIELLEKATRKISISL